MLPFAIDRSVLVAWARRSDGVVRAYSADFGEHARFGVPDVAQWTAGAWSGYVRGVVAVLAAAGHAVPGLDLAIAGDVPLGAGLSSSAAVEVAVMGAFRDAFALPIGDVDLALLCQRAENEYVGVQCGIMDQFASALSRRDHALLIDCRSLAHEAVPLRIDAVGLAVVIANSAVRRELVTSAYNDRRRECEQAVVELRGRLGRPGLTSLRDVTQAEIDAACGGAPSVPLRRARHVVSEIARVASAAEALRRDDFAELGVLMHESHSSLRDDYEVSSRELDLLVELAMAQEYVVGARLTGAGFGGCTVNLVRADAVSAFERDVIAPYRRQTGLPAVMYVTRACDGLTVSRF
ncbi:MAG: galactokinase [Chloroflexi bacterium]|nr:galactokinase [Chloroflexota bacterium]